MRAELRNKEIFRNLTKRLSLTSKKSLLATYITMEGGKQRQAVKNQLSELVFKSIPVKMQKNNRQLTFFYEFLQKQANALKKARFTVQYAKTKILADIFAELFKLNKI